MHYKHTLLLVLLSLFLQKVEPQSGACVEELQDFYECTGGVEMGDYLRDGAESMRQTCKHMNKLLKCYKDYHKDCFSASELADYCSEKAVWKEICDHLDVFVDGVKCMSEEYMGRVAATCDRSMEIRRVLTVPMTDEAWNNTCEMSVESAACRYGYIVFSNCSVQFKELSRRTNYASLHRICKDKHYVCSAVNDKHCTEDDFLMNATPRSLKSPPSSASNLSQMFTVVPIIAGMAIALTFLDHV